MIYEKNEHFVLKAERDMVLLSSRMKRRGN